jgi:ParB/RepB/Spo0J family partition protein
LAELANSLILEGQRQAAKGYLHEDGKHFVITAGQRRYRAMLYANENLDGEFEYIISDLEQKIDGKNPSGADLKFRQLADNNHEKICPEDQALAFKELIDKDEYTVAQIANRLGCSDQHIRDLLKFLEVPEDIKQAVHEKKLSHTGAVRTARARKEAQDEVRGRLEAGEHVSIGDVNKASGKTKTLTFEEIQKQIKKADAMMLSEKSNSGRSAWQGVIRGLRIAAGLEELLK